ncbi:MAG: selenocysteine-specific translation elongation factor [Defluviitaleaceae bacterium]|nr:selenocysteine-specific translation elongation factor [Defluviitaleaceae bacterium]
MKNVIIGTAGHIDHGKTTLIKALTDRSTDTLKEEIKRGISINLGFTYFDLPSGKRAGIVDVPGHERFIKNMLAGATGIDIVMLTIAANEGVKPQTIEHIDILSYLDIKSAIIVLTKADLADDIMTELVIDDIKEKIEGTFLENAPIIPVDSISKRGLDKLVATIDRLSDETQARNEGASPRLNIDRVFSMKGFGTIITGTLIEGRIGLEDEMTIYPNGIKTKIRSLQVHEESVKTAFAGQRTAVNISNVKPSQIRRGDVLAKAGSLEETIYLDVKISLLPHSQRTVRYWERIRLYLGCKEVLARLVLLDSQTINPGDSAYCQLRLEEPVAAKKNDRFVIRYYSPMETIGGGIILDPFAKRHAANEKILQALQVKEKGDTGEVVGDFIAGNKDKPTKLTDVSAYIGVSEDAAAEMLDKLQEQGVIIEMSRAYYHCSTVELFKEDILEILNQYHGSFPLKQGIIKEELRSKAKLSFKNKEFETLLKIMENEGLVRTTNSIVSIAGFEISYDKKKSAIKSEIEKALLDGKFVPPTVAEVTKGSKEYAEVLESLIGGSVTRLDEQTVIHTKYYEQAIAIVTDFIEKNNEITLAEFRDITGSSRKYSMIILEDFDKKKITKRLENVRVLYDKT